ncbi:response regulator [Pedobacter alpinus]|uniref:Response regulator n=1 Tax=Pedobacter alpinus TaxID=1590643 RepID=A0ABW5TV94_9SPHI
MKKIDLVCIVDDDPMHVFITKKYIELSGHVEKIIVCNNGKDAFHTLQELITNKETLPKIIFLDLNMPVWDGWQFLDEFTKIPTEDTITIYILTSSNSDADIEKAKQYSLTSNYLIKPISQSQLKEIIADHL